MTSGAIWNGKESGAEMIEIDGSAGEGGGQVIRTALTLSMLTGIPFRINKIRAGRRKPGIKNQHLTAVKASAKICDASVHGAELGSRNLVFNPGKVKPGNYSFKIQTAGSAPLVLQTLFLPLAHAERKSRIQITGGTHVRWSPNYHYLSFQWLPVLEQLGYKAEIQLNQCGYFPQGGGKISAVVEPVRHISPLEITKRGIITQISGISAQSNLTLDIARRQRTRFLYRLGSQYPINDFKCSELPGYGKGTFITAVLSFQGTRAVFSSLGEKGKRAEIVADELVDEVIKYLSGDAVWDPYLADQILLPLCFASQNSSIQPVQITSHLRTNAEVIQAFLPVEILFSDQLGTQGSLDIRV
jgi:RNA 3'-terminal phosphate cyclase (ATP)